MSNNDQLQQAVVRRAQDIQNVAVRISQAAEGKKPDSIIQQLIPAVCLFQTAMGMLSIIAQNGGDLEEILRQRAASPEAVAETYQALEDRVLSQVDAMVAELERLADEMGGNPGSGPRLPNMGIEL